MPIYSFNNFIYLSDKEVRKAISKLERRNFKLRLKKITMQKFSPAELKRNKCLISQLKTLLKIRAEYGGIFQ